MDIHKAIGKLPKSKSGFPLLGQKYTAPYNPLDERVLYDKISGEIIEIFDPPTGKTDAIAIQHDVDYSVCKDDKKMQKQSRQKNGKST